MNNILRILFLFCLIIGSTSLQAQTPPSNLTDSALRTWLKDNLFTGKHTTLSYSDARERMFGFIDNQSGKIYCVYSGYEKSVPAGSFITYPAPVNTEHTVPQSFFDGDLPMRSDIHHLFPTFENWNSERGSNKFDEIPDNSTTKWMYLNNSQSNIPSSNIDDYSESTNIRFEPKESHKGDLARAIFYFYTVYPSVGDITDVAAIETLCNWNNEDPPTAREIARNDAIETYQGNRNPYVDFLDLPEKAYGCASVSVRNIETIEGLSIDPNPALDRLEINSTELLEGRFQIFDAYGKMTQQGTINHSIEITDLPKGIYFILLQSEQKQFSHRFIKL